MWIICHLNVPGHSEVPQSSKLVCLALPVFNLKKKKHETFPPGSILIFVSLLPPPWFFFFAVFKNSSLTRRLCQERWFCSPAVRFLGSFQTHLHSPQCSCSFPWGHCAKRSLAASLHPLAARSTSRGRVTKKSIMALLGNKTEPGIPNPGNEGLESTGCECFSFMPRSFGRRRCAMACFRAPLRCSAACLCLPVRVACSTCTVPRLLTQAVRPGR